MSTKRYKPEQIVKLLRQIEVEMANGQSTPQACRDAQLTAQTYYRGRKELGGLKLEQAKRLKELEKENSRLKRLVAELSLGKRVLREFQWEAPGRRPEWRDLLLAEGGADCDRTVAGGVQHAETPLGARL